MKTRMKPDWYEWVHCHLSLVASLQLLLAVAVASASDPLAPMFHISPAQCHGGWTNDPNGVLD